MIRWSAIVLVLAAAAMTKAQDAPAPTATDDEVARLRLENAELKQQVTQLQKELAQFEGPMTGSATQPTTGTAGVYISETDIFNNFPIDEVPLGPMGWNQLQSDVGNDWLAKNIKGRTWRGPMTLEGIDTDRHSPPPGQPASAGQPYIKLTFHLEPSLKKKQLAALPVRVIAECDMGQTAVVARMQLKDRVLLEGKITTFEVLDNVGGLSFIMKLSDSRVLSTGPYPPPRAPIPRTTGH